MPSISRTLVVLALIGCFLAVERVADRHLAAARWPQDGQLFEVPGWSSGSETVEVVNTPDETDALVQRAYRRSGSRRVAHFTLWTHPQPQAKTQFRKGPDRDLLGAGYSIEPPPVGLVAPIEGGGALIARRGKEVLLGLYTFGEKRGRLGSGPLAWSIAEWDALMDRPNDYYLARVLVPLPTDAEDLRADVQLAEALFGRLDTWYRESAISALAPDMLVYRSQHSLN